MYIERLFAPHRGWMISTSELSQELSVPSSYIPKITKKLKQAGIIKACEGTNGGYMLAKQPENISLMKIISCVEETMAINRCLEEDRFCSRNLEDTCKIHKILLSLQNTYNSKLESVKVSDVIRPGEDEYFGRFYVVLKLNLKEKSYECVYSHIREVYEKVRKTESYEEFISQYVERYVYASDKKMVHDFLSSEGLEERLVDGCMEKDLPYRRITGKDKNAYVWMEAKKYIDANENTAIITLHNEKIVQNTVIKMEQELVKKEQDMAKQYCPPIFSSSFFIRLSYYHITLKSELQPQTTATLHKKAPYSFFGTGELFDCFSLNLL